jgi:predicted Fe-Mo cluster-binding NifX family protein
MSNQTLPGNDGPQHQGGGGQGSGDHTGSGSGANRVWPMRIILTVNSPSFDSKVDPRFGRSAYLLMVDTETQQWDAHANPGVNATNGAGIQAAQFVTEKKAEAVLSGDFGPHAFEALRAAGITMYLYEDCHTARQAIERFQAGQLRQAGTPTGTESGGSYHRRGR